MKPRQYAYFGGALLAAIVITIGGWQPLANADNSSHAGICGRCFLAQPAAGPGWDQW